MRLTFIYDGSGWSSDASSFSPRKHRWRKAQYFVSCAPTLSFLKSTFIRYYKRLCRKTLIMVNTLKRDLVEIIVFVNSDLTAMKTAYFTIWKIDRPMLFKGIITVHCENCTKHINTKWRVDSWSNCYIY